MPSEPDTSTAADSEAFFSNGFGEKEISSLFTSRNARCETSPSYACNSTLLRVALNFQGLLRRLPTPARLLASHNWRGLFV